MTARIPTPAVRPCAHCSTPYRPKCSHARYCSRVCCSIANNSKRTTATVYGWVPCAECERPFQKRSRVHSYCTRACKSTAHNKRRQNGHYNAPRPEDPYEPQCADSIQCWECCDMSWRRESSKGQPGPCHVCGEPYAPEPNLVVADFLRTRGNLERAQDMAPGRIGISNGIAAKDPADRVADEYEGGVSG